MLAQRAQDIRAERVSDFFSPPFRRVASALPGARRAAMLAQCARAGHSRGARFRLFFSAASARRRCIASCVARELGGGRAAAAAFGGAATHADRVSDFFSQPSGRTSAHGQRPETRFGRGSRGVRAAREAMRSSCAGHAQRVSDFFLACIIIRMSALFLDERLSGQWVNADKRATPARQKNVYHSCTGLSVQPARLDFLVFRTTFDSRFKNAYFCFRLFFSDCPLQSEKESGETKMALERGAR